LVLTNEAGDQEKKRVALNVTGPIGFTFDPPLAVPGQQVTMEWDFGSATGVYGAPVGETRKGPEPFVDISTSPGATELKDLYVTSSTAKSQKLVFPDGFRFHHFGSMYGEAQVTNRGWLSFDETASGSTITATIPSAAQPNNFIAAWASDALRGGKVFWELKGTAPNRELIIQWNEFANATTNSKLTFEVILHENGQVDMLYKEMVATSTTVTIGMESADGRLGYASTFTAAPASGDSVTFNGAGPKTGTVSFAAPGSTSRYQMVVDLGTAKVPVSATLPVIQPGSVRISEVMYKPVGAATAGQWVELHNKSGAALDLRHFTLKTDAGSQPLPTHSLADGAFVVIGQSSDTAANGGTPVNVALPALSLGAATDTVQLLLGTAIISSTSYDDAALAVAAGTSIGANPGFIPAFCISAATYGSAGSKGTPGAQGADCGGYNVSKIPGAYTAVTNSTGTLLLEDEQSVRVAYTFPSGFKFPFDGADRTQVLVGIGYLSFDLAKGATTADTYDAAPSSMTDPNGIKGVIAPMWQRFGYNENFYSRVHTRLVSNPDGNPATADSYLVFQWSGHTPAGNSYGYVNFQAWLFENGNVEFHYGDLYEDSDYDFWTGDYFFYGLVDGSDAAIGISSMSNAGAVVFGYKQPVLTHKMGVRFAKY
ncbi:MAG: lamin tail domain-containing protein, partial [Myxococcales bacterium]